VKLDPEERIIAAALDEAELNDANVRGAGARIEFKREGHAKVTITISRELVERAKALDLTAGELFAEAVRLAVPGAFDLARPHASRWH
jgi:post-segregation antitoxin (ccd killing protein)